MADRSAIEWTDASWNPIRARNLKTGKVGWHCEHATTGCEHCYSEGFNKRLGTGLAFKPGHRKDIEIFLDEQMLTQPLRWKTPRKIFVCSMTDAFAEFVSDEMLDKMFAVMALCPQHTFQVLTKRAKRMREYMLERWQPAPARSVIGIDVPAETKGADRRDQIVAAASHLIEDHDDLQRRLLETENDAHWTAEGNAKCLQFAWPLPNVWLGISAERQQEADERIPDLLATPAAIRFLSLEPLLGPIDLGKIAAPKLAPDDEAEGWKFDCLSTGDYYTLWADDPFEPEERCVDSGDGPYRETKIDQVIVGGESGNQARPVHPGWPRALRDQCAVAETAFFFKQWGAWCPGEEPASETQEDEELRNAGVMVDDQYMRRVGKKAAGRLLDGVEHSAFPTVPA